MASKDPSPDCIECPVCGSPVYGEPPRLLRKKKKTIFDKLPKSDHPWIIVRFKDHIIFSNAEWSPFVLYPDGTIEAIESHMPTTTDAGVADLDLKL